MKTDYHFKRKSNSVQEWFESLPIPYNLSEVNKSDKMYEKLKLINKL